jgi:hypothetical protein
MPIRAKAAGSRFSPPSASGRPREQRVRWRWLCTGWSARCDGGRGMTGRPDLMTSLRARPREIYRVYDEHEFLEGVLGSELSQPIAPGPPERRLRRLAGTATLVGTVGTVSGVIAVNTLLAPSGAGPRARGSVHAAADRSYARQAPSTEAAFAGASAPISWSLPRPGAYQHGSAYRPGGAYRPSGAHRRGRAGRSLFDRARERVGVEPHRVRTIVAHSILAVRPGGVVATVASASGAPPSHEHAEFGFER